MIATIQIGSAVSAQGPVVAEHDDGKVTVDAGGRRITGFPIEKVNK